MTPKERAEALGAGLVADGYTEQEDISAHIAAIEKAIIDALEEQCRNYVRLFEDWAVIELQNGREERATVVQIAASIIHSKRVPGAVLEKQKVSSGAKGKKK